MVYSVGGRCKYWCTHWRTHWPVSRVWHILVQYGIMEGTSHDCDMSALRWAWAPCSSSADTLAGVLTIEAGVAVAA